MNNVLIIGTGHMGEQILKAMTQNLSKTEYKITIINRNESKSINLAKNYGCNCLKNINESNINDFNIFILALDQMMQKIFLKTFQ
ncbi:NAD(P)-binding domain-containing protein [Spiroplasma litorale]|uniref:NAD(P)-binding domain-containing protein n=1 Tax=Spiroplasma litorale TaxID=216942 RepID=UPI0009466717|nr:NAD(P)-binding domain-containing protein [Spiroplasma litorale]